MLNRSFIFRFFFTLLLGCFFSPVFSQQQLLLNCDELNTVMCEGNCVDIFPIVSGGVPPYAFQWSDGSTQTNPVFCQPGQYSVTVSDKAGDLIECTFFIEILDPVRPEIVVLSGNVCQDSINGNPSTGGGCEEVCPGAEVTYQVIDVFTGQPIPGGLGNASWTANNAASTQMNSDGTFTVVWGQPGVGTISYIDFDFQTGCEVFTDACVTIIVPPEAKIGSNPAADPLTNTITVCKNQQIYFQNLTNESEYIEWNFGDGFTSILDNPSHGYGTAGTYEVTLIANNACFCNDTSMVMVEVLDGEAPLINCIGTVCAGQTVTYTTNSVCAPFNWSVSPNGSIVNGGSAAEDSIVIQWNAGAVGEIILDVSACGGGCAQPAVAEIPIIDNSAKIEGPQYVCPISQSEYSIEAFGGTGFNWRVLSGGFVKEGQGTDKITVDWTANHSPTTPRKVIVDYDNCYLGCQGSDTLDVFILSEHTITGPVEICAGADETYTARRVAGNVQIDCNWVLYDETDAAIWSSPSPSTIANVTFPDQVGFFFLKATRINANESCTEIAEWTIQTRPNPAALIGINGPTEICPSSTYGYSVSGIMPDLVVEWALTGATIPSTTGEKILVEWAGTAPFGLEARHKTVDNLGCTSPPVFLTPTEINIQAIQGPNVSCEENTTEYTIGNLPDETIEWTITPSDAGTVADGQGTGTVSIFWTKGGNATISATICSQTVQTNVLINALPSTTINHPVGLCPGSVANVTANGAFVNYVWSNADGTPVGAGPSPNVGPGSYTLLFVDGNGCAAAKEFTIESYPVPEVTLSTPDPTGFCNNSRFVNMDALTTTDGDYDFAWTRDNVDIGVSTISHSDNQYGVYRVEVTNQWGCTAESNPVVIFEYCGGGVCHNPSVNPCGDASIQYDAIQDAQCTDFTFTNITPNTNYVAGSETWLLIGPDNFPVNPELGNPLPYSFNNAGHYVVIMEVDYQDPNTGQKAKCGVVDSVKVRAAAAFDVEENCPGTASNFIDISTLMPGESITNWAWDFGDPTSGAANTVVGKDATHVFANPGNYTVTLTITSASGCTSSRTQTIEIQAPPNLDFVDPPATCEDNAVPFVVISSSPLVDMMWDFNDPFSGDANTSEAQNPFHTFADAGTYSITVEGKNAYGCLGSFSKNVSIALNLLSGNAQASPNPPLCPGEATSLTAPTGGTAWEWSTGESTNVISATDEDIYTVQITDANGCSYTPPSINVDVLDPPLGEIKAYEINDFGQVSAVYEGSYSACAGEAVNLEVQSNGINSYTWTGGYGGQSLQFDDTHEGFLPVGSHTYYVTVTESSNGCTNTIGPFTVVINPKPNAPLVSSTMWPICAGSNIPLSLNATEPGVQYTWNTGDMGSDITVTNAGEYYAVAMNGFGCRAESNHLKIDPGPRIESVPSGCHTRCNPDTLCLPVLFNIQTYQWYFNGTALGAPSNTSDFVATETGVYSLEMTDYYGCVAMSGAIELDLYDGYGAIEGLVYDDVNKNGIIDAADTLVAGIPLLLDGMGTNLTGTSGPLGNYAFANILSQNYNVEIDALNLPSDWSIIIGQGDRTLSGCDDVEKLDFLIDKSCPPIFMTDQVSACVGDSTLYGGIYIQAGVTDTLHFTSSQGCDSMIAVTCTALPIPSKFEQLNICQGDSMQYNGIWYHPNDKDTLSFASAVGCDSLVFLECLAVQTTTGNEDVTVCPGLFYIFQNDTLQIGETATATFQNQWGCDSTVAVEVFESPIPSFAVGTTDDCIGQFSGSVWCDMTGSPSDLSFSLDGTTFQNDSLFTGLSARTGMFYLRDENGCDFSSPFEITENRPPSGTLPILKLPCGADPLEIIPALDANALSNQYLWHTMDTTSTLMVMETGNVTVDITNACGTLHLEQSVAEADTSQIDKLFFASNIFAPNESMFENTQFCIQVPPEHEVLAFDFKVFDRWGSMLFHGEQTDACWDGYHNGKMLDPAVFVWTLDMTVQGCRLPIRVTKAGDVLLLR